METFQKHIKFEIDNKWELREKVVRYFTESGLKLLSEKDNYFKFGNESSFFAPWMFNPLKWGSEIIITIVDQEISLDLLVDFSGQMNTFEEEKIWETFTINFQLFLTNNFDFKNSNNKVIKETKKRSLFYIGFAISGAVIGGVTGAFISYFSGIEMLTYLGVPLGACFFLNKKIMYIKTRNAL